MPLASGSPSLATSEVARVAGTRCCRSGGCERRGALAELPPPLAPGMPASKLSGSAEGGGGEASRAEGGGGTASSVGGGARTWTVAASSASSLFSPASSPFSSSGSSSGSSVC